MEKNNCTIVNEVFVYKTKYIVHVVVDMIILERDNCWWFKDKRNWQIGWNFNNEDSWLPIIKILQCGWQMINILQKKEPCEMHIMNYM